MVYWLVFFSIIIHGLSVPILHLIYRIRKVPKVHDEHPIEIVLLSNNEPLPVNSTANPQRHSAILNNRFSRQDENDEKEDGPGAAECASSSGDHSAMQGIRRALTIHNPPQHHHNHNHNHNSPSSGSHHHHIFRRARSSFDRHHPHIHHNYTNPRHNRTSLHGSDVIEILSHQNEQSPGIKPQSLSDSSRTSTDMGPSSSRREVPHDMI